MITTMEIELKALPSTDPPRLILEVSWEGLSHPGSQLLVPRLVSKFVALGALGGLAGIAASPAGSAVALEEEVTNERGGRWVLKAQGVDVQATTVLRNVVAFSHAYVNPLRSARIICTLPRAAEIARAPKPLSGRSNLPFEANIAVDSDDVFISVQFAPSLPTSARKGVNNLLLAWAYIAAAGGFEEGDDIPKNPLAIPADEPVWLNDEVSFQLARVAFRETAFDSLLNALCGVHLRVWPVTSVDIQ